MRTCVYRFIISYKLRPYIQLQQTSTIVCDIITTFESKK